MRLRATRLSAIAHAVRRVLGLPLDSLTAAAAYSTRKLRSDYTGAALRVRRSFDSAESDIGFVGNDFDTTALMNFVGSQNLLLHSDGLFTSPWIAGPAHTRTANADVAPDGTTTATLITNTSASTGNFTYQLQSTVTEQRTFSVYGKAGTNRYIWMYSGIGSTANYGALFDLQDGVFVLERVNGPVTGASASIQSVGNGWFRCAITQTQATSQYVAVTATNNTTPTFNSNNDITNCTAGTVLVWGAQFNQGTLQPYSSTTTTARDGNGFVTTWYDQSGNGRNATQATAANQPSIVTAGVVNTVNGKPVQRFNGSAWLSFSSLTLTDFATIWVSRKRDATVVSQSIILARSGLSRPYAGDDVNGVGNPNVSGAGSDIVRTTLGNTSPSGGEDALHTSYAQRIGNQATGGMNGQVNPNATVETTSMILNIIGRYTNLETFNYVGDLTELMIMTTALSTDNRQTLERNQGAYYGVTVA